MAVAQPYPIRHTMAPMQLPHRRIVMVLLCLSLAACGAPAPTPSDEAVATTTAEPTPTPMPSRSAAPPSQAATPTPVPTLAPIAEDPPALALEPVASGLADPIGIATGPDGWLLVQEQSGRVIAVELASGATSVALDLTDRVLGGGERGLLGLVLHPGWPDDGRAFVHYSDRNGDTVLSEFRSPDAAGTPPSFDAGSERVLLTVDQPFSNHNGGQLAFGPDGHLWFGLGDGGSGGDPMGNGQNPDALLGKVLRLDVDGVPAGDAAYAIPEDNPFAGGGAPEAYLIGLRNPWRFSFDRATDELWIADVGQNAYEEIDRLDPVADAGANLGWNRMEASHCYLSGCSMDGLLLPVAEYGRDLGCSVTGGHVYRGAAIDGLAGWYLFSDYCSGLLFGVRSDAGIPAPGESAMGPRILLETGANVTSFGEDAGGELYLVDVASGTLYRIVAAS
jgi:glucose/arabinose dehydrogenase